MAPRDLWGIDVASVRGPLALADESGRLLRVADETRALLERCASGTAALPPDLWRSLERVSPGASVEWFPARAHGAAFQCSRFPLDGPWIVLLREVSSENDALSRKLHRQRLEVTGRLVASIAHELRNSVSSLIYSADLLSVRDQLPPSELEEVLSEITQASRRLQQTVDGLLDHARLGPTVSVPVSLREVLTRAQGFLRSYYRSRAHVLRVTVPPEAEWVQGNSIVVEQVFVNLLLNAAEAATHPIAVHVDSKLALPPLVDRPMVRVRVHDDGPGVPAALRSRVFEPFVTSRPNGTGLGLANSREAVESLGGTITLSESGPGATFIVDLPRALTP